MTNFVLVCSRGWGGIVTWCCKKSGGATVQCQLIGFKPFCKTCRAEWCCAHPIVSANEPKEDRVDPCSSVSAEFSLYNADRSGHLLHCCQLCLGSVFALNSLVFRETLALQRGHPAARVIREGIVSQVEPKAAQVQLSIILVGAASRPQPRQSTCSLAKDIL